MILSFSYNGQPVYAGPVDKSMTDVLTHRMLRLYTIYTTNYYNYSSLIATHCIYTGANSLDGYTHITDY